MTAVSERDAELMYAAPRAPAPDHDQTPHWTAATRVAFRLCCLYFGLFVLTTQMLPSMLPVPYAGLPDLQKTPPVRALVLWVGGHVLALGHPISIAPSGSGDTTYDWVQSFSLLLLAVIGTALWTVAVRDRVSHARLYSWFRVFLRFALGTTMLSYGFAKAVPIQMPTLFLTRLVEPYGNFSPMGVLWYSIGASPAYETFVGLAEICGGTLLFLPRTALLGALMCLMDTIAVFTLNMTYDVPVKLFSFHLVLMSLFLIAPNARRLLDFFLFHRRAEAAGEPALGRDDSGNRRWVIAQATFGVVVLLLGGWGDVSAWKQFGAGAPKSALYGIWDVSAMSVDGATRAPLLTDTTRWRRVIFQHPTSATFQRPNDAFVTFGARIDTVARTLTITAFDAAKTVSVLSYQRPSKDRLILDGPMDGGVAHLELAFRDPDSFLIRSRGFHWVQEFPFNR